MFDEMPQYEMASGAGERQRVWGVRQRRVADRRGVEALGELGIQRFQRPEIPELLGVARRIRVAARDDVAPVRPMLARGPEKLLAASQCRGEVVTQRPGGLRADPMIAVRKPENQFVVDGFSVRRFLDQPPADGFLYPPGMPDGTSYSSRGRSHT